MKNLRVAAITGELCMCHEEGQALLKVLQPALKAGKVCLDFSETRLHMPPFFNSGIVPRVRAPFHVMEPGRPGYAGLLAVPPTRDLQRSG